MAVLVRSFYWIFIWPFGMFGGHAVENSHQELWGRYFTWYNDNLHYSNIFLVFCHLFSCEMCPYLVMIWSTFEFEMTCHILSRRFPSPRPHHSVPHYPRSPPTTEHHRQADQSRQVWSHLTNCRIPRWWVFSLFTNLFFQSITLYSFTLISSLFFNLFFIWYSFIIFNHSLTIW